MTTFRRFLVTSVAALLATALLASCGNSPTLSSDGEVVVSEGVAAVVNGIDIDAAAFEAEIDILAEHPDFAAAAFGARSMDPDNAAADPSFVASVLTVRIFVTLADAEFEDRGLELADDDMGRVDDTFTEALHELLDELPAEYRDEFRTWNARLLVLRDDLAAEAGERPETLGDDEVQAFFDLNSILFGEQVCARHVLVDTSDEADEVLADLEGGADFGELAAERSIDPSAAMNGGDLGCADRGRYVPEFEDMVWTGEIGEFLGPVQTDFGYHVIIVDSRGEVTFESMEEELREFLESPQSRDGQSLFNIMVQRMVATADVQVNAKFGSWDSDARSVVPPETSLDNTVPETTVAP